MEFPGTAQEKSGAGHCPGKGPGAAADKKIPTKTLLSGSRYIIG
jgi:hypothetical protein